MTTPLTFDSVRRRRTTTPHVPGPLLRRDRRHEAFATGSWLFVGLVMLVAMAAAGDDPRTVLTYVMVWFFSTTMPGVLVWRALARPTTLVQEVGGGSVLGIGLLLLAWVPATLLDRPLLMWLWPVGLAAVFLVSPSLRRHWLPLRSLERGTPLRWHLAMSGVVLLAFLRVWAKTLRPEALPPHVSTVFQDVWYELSLTQQLAHSVVISDPAVAGVPLRYHWFSNAHAAATQALSGAAPDEVILHLWLVPMLLTFVLAVAAAGERMLEGAGSDGTDPARRWWPGPLAALLVAGLPVTLSLGAPRPPAIDNGFVTSSTSGMLALTIVLVLACPVLDLLHGRATRGTWILLALLLALSSGSKPSILPVVACGSALALVAVWVQTRRFPRLPAALTLLPLLLIPLSAVAVVGSTGGSRLQLFDTLSLDPAFQQAAGGRGLPGHGGWLAPGLQGGSGHVWLVAAGLFALYVLTELPRLLGTFLTADRRLWADPGVWWCTGVVAAGFCGLWVLAHPAYGQHYFWRIVIGLGMVLTVTSAARLIPRAADTREIRQDLLILGIGGLVTGVGLLPTELVDAASLGARLLPYAVAVAVLLLLLTVSRLRHGRLGTRAGRRLPVLVLMTCFCITAAVPTAVGRFGRSVGSALVGTPSGGPSSRLVTGAEQRAALWLKAHSAPADVVATNVFCAPQAYHRGCRHVSFWVSALTGRQLLLGSWAYTEKSLSAYAHEDNNYQLGPSPWPERLAASLAAVRSPTPAAISRLQQYGVDWIFADRHATRVSPALGRYARLSYANSAVSVYRLDRPHLRR